MESSQEITVVILGNYEGLNSESQWKREGNAFKSEVPDRTASEGVAKWPDPSVTYSAVIM